MVTGTLFLPEACSFIGENAEQTVAAATPLDGDAPVIGWYRDLARRLGIWLSIGGFQVSHSMQLKYVSHQLLPLFSSTILRCAAHSVSMRTSFCEHGHDMKFLRSFLQPSEARSVSMRNKNSVCWFIQETSEDPGRLYNTHILLNGSGDLLACYRKIHLFDVDVHDGPILMESRSTAPGDDVIFCFLMLASSRAFCAKRCM